MAKLLTKSKYLAGLESDCLLWKLVHDPNSLPAVDAFTQAKFDAGHEVGELAKQLFDGEDVTGTFIENIRKTKELVAAQKTIFEAGFMIDGLYARSDVLVPVDGAWDLIEVKSSTSAKEIHAKDLAFQKYVLEKSGLSIRNCFVVHVNKEYVRQGDLDLSEFFVKTDVTADVAAVYSDVPANVAHMLDVIALPSCPPFEYHDIVRTEYGNPLVDSFMADLPSGSVFELYNIRKKKALNLLDDAIINISELPEDFKLTDKQEIQKQCLLSGKQHVSVEGLRTFISGLQYPLYHLDFETYDSVIPLFDGMRPNMKIPFQYSLHIEQEDGSLVHKEFLFTGEGDCRLAFLESLQKDLGSVGTVLVYNQAFELGRLKELAEMFPSYASFVSSVIARVVDLIVPFREFWFYDSRQKGSCSIKNVLPVFSSLSYKSLAVQNGAEASILYFKHFVKGLDHPDKAKLREDLLEYCKLDTFGMVEILNGLKKLIVR